MDKKTQQTIDVMLSLETFLRKDFSPEEASELHEMLIELDTLKRREFALTRKLEGFLEVAG